MSGNLSVLVNVFFILATLIMFGVWLMDRLYWKQYQDIEYEKDSFIQISYDLLPVLLFVAIFRTYIVEPFSIPSESMEPILKKGDFILVNKVSYGLKYPFTNTNMFRTGEPVKGDVAVFKYPLQQNVYFVKRIIGGPGDVLIWKDNDFFINGKKIQTEVATGPNIPFNNAIRGERFEWETINGNKHLTRFLQQTNYDSYDGSPYLETATQKALAAKKYNRFQLESPDLFRYYEVKVPKDYYFVMGDNRDQSLDSRAWGLVNRDAFVGRVYYLALHSDPKTPIWKFWDKFTLERSKSIN
jgi:signal peptidase I